MIKKNTPTERSIDKLLRGVKQRSTELRTESVCSKGEVNTFYAFEDIIGSSEILQKVLVKIRCVAETNASVLLLGETGTGKELFARAVHNLSARRNRSLIKVNCAALQSNLIESELFGHVRGSFTTAVSDREGRFQLADGGTLFLDEIGEIDRGMQAKLLRVLQEGEFEKVGGTKTIRVDVRLIAATNRDLSSAVAANEFRSDLYYRLSVFPIEIPPLRERPEDIPLLVQHFVAKKQRKLGKEITNVEWNTMSRLLQYDWPGNIRELENVIERAMILCSGSILTLDRAPATLALERAPDHSPSKLQDVLRAHILLVLEQCDWRVKGNGNAADRLGLNPSTLRYHMGKLGIQRP